MFSNESCVSRIVKFRFISSHGYAKQLISTSLFILLGSTFEYTLLFYLWTYNFYPIWKRFDKDSLIIIYSPNPGKLWMLNFGSNGFVWNKLKIADRPKMKMKFSELLNIKKVLFSCTHVFFSWIVGKMPLICFKHI